MAIKVLKRLEIKLTFTTLLNNTQSGIIYSFQTITSIIKQNKQNKVIYLNYKSIQFLKYILLFFIEYIYEE